jgi:hypothetical protein
MVVTAGVAIGRICNTPENQEVAVWGARSFWMMKDSERPQGQQARTCEARSTNAVASTTLRQRHAFRAKIIPHLVLAKRQSGHQAVRLLLAVSSLAHDLVRQELDHALCPAVARRIPSTDRKAMHLGSHQCTNPTHDYRLRSKCYLPTRNAWQRSKGSYRAKKTTMRCTREGLMGNRTTCENQASGGSRSRISNNNNNNNNSNITSAQGQARQQNQHVHPTLRMELGLSQVLKKVTQAVPVPVLVVAATALLPQSQIARISRVTQATRLRRPRKALQLHTTLRLECLTSTKTRKSQSRGRRRAAWGAL